MPVGVGLKDERPTLNRMNIEHRTFNFDKIVKSRFKDWIPAFAGMTSAHLSDIKRFIVIPAQAGIQKME
jgi:hypothetical protein